MSIRFPAEWEPLDGVLLTWPHQNSDWADLFPKVELYYFNLANQIAQYAKVIIAAPKGYTDIIQRSMQSNNYQIFEVNSNDTWARDHGPITIYDGKEAKLLDFTFNGWGNKFDAELDNLLTRGLYTQGCFDVDQLKSLDLVLEGGSIESDGKGTLLTTKACLLNKNRNPTLDQKTLEANLKQELGVDTIHWLSHGELAGDDTDAHIDTLARLCPNDTICYVQSNDCGDEHYDSLTKMEYELGDLRSSAGKPYTLIPLPMPAPILDPDDGHRLPATYANFLICNNAVFVPTYRDENDALALKQVAKAFPEHNIIGIDSRILIRQHGSLHCITMQLPKGVLRND